MKSLAIMICLLLLMSIGMVGCTAEEETPGSTQTPAATATPEATATPAGTPEATGTPVPSPGATGLFLDITAPEDEAIVETGTVTVVGTTIADAVVTVLIGETIAFPTVDETGGFSVDVALEEGLNEIEVVASDWQGNEVDAFLTVIYLP